MAPYLNPGGDVAATPLPSAPGSNGAYKIEDKSMPIAIVGMSFRGPADATSVENLWRMIAEGREGSSEIPRDRWNNEAFYHPNSARNGTHNVEAGHFMADDLSRFDAPFFGMTSAEVAALDPQQRLLLECTYEALENSGTPLDDFFGTQTSVFVGSFCGDYTDMLLRDPDTVPMYQCTNSGHSRATLANRLSYFFDLHGPSVTIDTACSASLVSLHLGCQSLRTGDAKRAIVAGANVILSHEIMIAMSMMRFMSPDGRCYTFDDRANGYARGEGVGSIILKPLEDALKDGDTIRAVIRGTGSNQDGKTSGITLPSATAQEALIRKTYEDAGLNPADTSYVEAHGTGTPAGDPLETGALSKVFCAARPLGDPLKIGSIKTNVGHLEGASGIAGVIKTVLMLENQMILPNRNFRNGNPRIPFDEWKLKVVTALDPWIVDGPRRASVNSFGYGGSNAHAILEDTVGYMSSHGLEAPYRRTKSLLAQVTGVPSCMAPSGSSVVSGSPSIDSFDRVSNGFSDGLKDESINTTPTSTDTKVDLNGDFTSKIVEERSRLFVLSSADEAAGKTYAKKLASYLEERLEDADSDLLDNLAYTLGEKRSRFLWKAAISANSTSDLIDKLRSDVTFSKNSKKPVIGFAFTGQGAQWCGMGRELLAAYPIFRNCIDQMGAKLTSIGAPFDLKDEITRDAKGSQIGLALYSQPICTAVQIALVDLLGSWGITPASVTGHSSGEIAAAYAFGALTWEDAIEVAYYRGVASTNMRKTGKINGAMMAVGMSEEEVQPYMSTLTHGQAKVACVNSPSSTTISGDLSAIGELQGVLKEQGIFARKLAVEVAYHSHHMALVAEEYSTALSKITPLPEKGDVQFFSSVTGKRVSSASELGAAYWVANMVSQVKFATSLQQLCYETHSGKKQRKRASAPSVNTLIELGPHSALAGPIRQTLQADPKLNGASIEYMSALTRQSDAVKTAQEVASKLIMRGHSVAFDAINRPSGKESRNLLVDLPSYSWNHHESYWAEPRISTVFRNRRFPRTDLLGALDKNSNPLEPRWRNHLRTSEIPWVNDHQVQNNVVYPAAGYIVMAIEAASQRATERSVTNMIGYKLREISVGAALIVPEQDGEVEVLVTFKPYTESIRSPSDVWDEFCVFSVTNDNSWTEHCRGLVSVATVQKSTNMIDGEVVAQTEKKANAAAIAEAEGKCVKDVDVQEFYAHLSSLGLEYGPTFANMTKARSARNSCVAEIVMPDTAAVMPMNFQYPFLIHPAMLDSMLHPIFVALSAEVGLLQDPAVPVLLGEMFVSTKIANQPGESLTTYTSTKKKDERYITASLIAVDRNRPEEPVLTMTDLECTILAKDVVSTGSQELKRLAHNFEWRPDVDLLSSQAVGRLCLPEPLTEEAMGAVRVLNQAAFYYFEWTLKMLAPSEVENMYPHHQKFWKCMQSHVEQVQQAKPDSPFASWNSASPTERADVRHGVRDSGAEGNLLCHIGHQLPAILRKEVEPTYLMAEEGHLGGHLEAYKKESVRYNCSFQSLAKYLSLLGHKNPHLSILEIGAADDGATSTILQALGGSEDEIPRIERYTYTDVSKDGFDQAKERYTHWKHLMRFQTLDIEADPLGQGHEAGSYDVIIAAHSLGRTRSTSNALKNVRKLMRPGGRLLLIEMTRDCMSNTILFGTLPSWWVGSQPSMSEQQWHDALEQSGFSGLEASVPDFPSEPDHHISSMMVSTAPAKANITTPNVLIIAEEHDCGVSLVRLLGSLSELGISVEVATLAKARPDGNVCIVLSELCRSYLYEPSAQDFSTIKDIFLRAAGVLWVVRGSFRSPADPNGSLALGLARTARAENGDVAIVTLDLENIPKDNASSDNTAADHILTLLKRHFATERENGDEKISSLMEVEYAEGDGLLTIPRIVENNALNKTLQTAASTPVPKEQPFHQPGRPLRMELTPGFLDSIRFVDDDRFTEGLADDHVEMEVRSIGLNFKDVMMGLGQILSEALGGEGAGVVSRVGKGVEGFAVGDRVSCYGFGTFSNFYRGPVGAFQKMPEEMSFELGSALPVTYCTAYYSVYHLARVTPGDSVLIHAATGGLGQAIIELCQLIGAEIFATVGTLEKKTLLMERFGMAEDHIFFSRDGSFASGIMRMTGGKGADVIMNSLAGEALRLTWNCIAPYGRFIELGARDLTVNTRLEMGNFLKNPMFAAFNLVYLIRQKKDVADKVWADVMDLFRNGSCKGPTPLHAHPISDVEKALRIMQTGRHTGKLVAVADPGVTVKAMPQDASKRLLRADASYLIVGGLGGIGRATASWMMEHGAKNIIFANRSGLARSESKEAVQALQAKGATVAVYACDVSESTHLADLISESSKTMPPIRGVIHSAMVLRDMLLDKMTLEDFNAVMRPKVHGTWNLHKLLLPHPLDFFLMLSSVSGIIGNATQAAYAAGSTFMDSFASYRNSLGLPATTLDLGVITGIGYLTKNKELAEGMERQGFEGTNEEQLMALIQSAIAEPRQQGALAQTITGLGSYQAGSSLGAFDTPPFAHFRRRAALESSGGGGGGTQKGGRGSASDRIGDTLRQASSFEEAVEKIGSALVARIAARSGIPAENIDTAKAITEFGIDSLVAVELRNWLAREMESTVPILDLLANQSLVMLAGKIAHKSRLVTVAAVGGEKW